MSISVLKRFTILILTVLIPASSDLWARHKTWSRRQTDGRALCDYDCNTATAESCSVNGEFTKMRVWRGIPLLLNPAYATSLVTCPPSIFETLFLEN